jgi:P27 family predicted phage terminase small subunit
MDEAAYHGDERQMIEPPTTLSPEAKPHWDRLSPELEAAGRMTEHSAGVLSALCVAYARWQDAEREIASRGVIVKSINGFPIQNPFLAVANKAIAQIRALSAELGMTPKSEKAGKTRPRLTITTVAEELSRLEAEVTALAEPLGLPAPADGAEQDET